MKIILRTLTPIWTGGVDQTSDRLHETGLIGSLRWWYEALVRGLGGYACDPTSEDRCPDKDGKHCAACELFGCTGWGRKFRLRVLDVNGQIIQTSLQSGVEFTLEFIELHTIILEEKWMLAKAIEIAARYGALGGKTSLKPQKGPMGEDYGIVQWIGTSENEKPGETETFLKDFRQGDHPSEYPDLRHFFFFSGVYLSRSQMNPLLRLDEKGKLLPNPDEAQKFLQGRKGAGQQGAISKKLFSFQTNGGRIWGYGKDTNMRDEIINRIKQQIDGKKYAVKTGEEVLHEL